MDVDEVEIWRIPLEAGQQISRECEALLSPDELARAQRFVTADLRRRFVTCRGSLRKILSRAIGVEPERVRFEYERWGKPRLAAGRRHAGDHIHFNVSHSEDVAFIAVARSPVGIDAEIPTRKLNYRAILPQVLSPKERLSLEKLPAREHEKAVLQLWVCKESILKAMGLGIAEGLHQISFPLPIPSDTPFSADEIAATLQLHLDDDGSCRMTSWVDPATWCVRLLGQFPDCITALTTMRHIRRWSVCDSLE